MGKNLLDCILDKVVDKTIDAMGGKDAVNGKIGEAYTARELKLLNLLGRKGKVLRNVYIPKDNNETSEVDVLFITQKGIFVIESKNYSGWIFGSENQYKWTMMLPNKETHSFYNPIKQNQTEVEAVYQKLKKLTKVTKEEKEIHIQDIKEKYDEISGDIPITVTDEKAKICPRCGSMLVLRIAKKGTNAGKQFYGCSAFPKCRYLKNI